MIRTVKKLLLIFLLLALPFQYSWAAAAAYCQHEEAHASHFGHHSHHHVAQAETADEQGKLAKFDNDCGYCHLSCQATPLTAVVNLNMPEATAPPVGKASPFSSHFPESPRRPDRALVA